MWSIRIQAFLFIFIFVASYQIVDGGWSDYQKRSILISFMRLSHLICRDPSPDFLKGYSDDILGNMESLNLKAHDLDIIEGIRQVNSEIFHQELVKKEATEPEEKVIFRALDLMLPDFVKSPAVEAKSELREFFNENKVLGQELLNRIKTKLMAKQLSTKNLVSMLLSYQDQWIPLGRLQSLLKSN